jgi:hypothetical protein
MGETGLQQTLVIKLRCSSPKLEGHLSPDEKQSEIGCRINVELVGTILLAKSAMLLGCTEN